jgi:hypothetical protein
MDEPAPSKEWRDRAEEYRAWAATAPTATGRQAYLDLAKNCEIVAERIERRGRKPPDSRSRA